MILASQECSSSQHNVWSQICDSNYCMAVQTLTFCAFWTHLVSSWLLLRDQRRPHYFRVHCRSLHTGWASSEGHHEIDLCSKPSFLFWLRHTSASSSLLPLYYAARMAVTSLTQHLDCSFAFCFQEKLYALFSTHQATRRLSWLFKLLESTNWWMYSYLWLRQTEYE